MHTKEPKPKVSVIVPTRNDAASIAKVMAFVQHVHPLTEVIVVDNGSTDGTGEIADRMGATVIRYPTSLGHDVGRSAGARAARGDILLFTNGDVVIGTEQLVPFIEAVERGVDVALNRYEGTADKARRIGLSTRVLNALLSVPWLGAASLMSIPHAISRKALDTIGWQQLAVPPKAQAIALASGLLVETVLSIEVTPPSTSRRKSPDPLAELIVGDHLEAIHWLVDRGNPRVNFPDLGRLRGKVRD